MRSNSVTRDQAAGLQYEVALEIELAGGDVPAASVLAQYSFKCPLDRSTVGKIRRGETSYSPQIIALIIGVLKHQRIQEASG